MNYNSIVERFKEIVTDHNQLQDFGYGNLSDIKTRSEGGTTTNTDYPYLFVNPTSHSRGTRSVTYNFNLIVMDMAKDDNFLKIQSECQQYIDDVLARLRFYYTDQVDLLLTNITLTPFKERFQDTVAGMTATISIEVPLPLNECIAPFVSVEPEPEPDPININVTTNPATNETCDNGVVEFTVSDGYIPQVLEYRGQTYNITTDTGTTITIDNQAEGSYTWQITESNDTIHEATIDVDCTYVPPTGCTLVVDVESDRSQGFDPDGGEGPIQCQIIHLTDGGWREDVPGVGGNYYIPQTLGPYTWTITATAIVEQVNPGDTLRPFILSDRSSNIEYQPTQIIGWPETTPAVGTEFSFELTYENVVPANTSAFTIAIAKNLPEEQAAFALYAGTRIEICLQSPEPTYTKLVTAQQSTSSFNDLASLPAGSSLAWVSDGSTLNDGNWDDYEYSPQTDKPYKWVFTGRVQFYGGGDLGEAYEVRDKVYGENTPAITSNWPTNPTVAQIYEFEMVWEGIQRQPQSWPFGLEIVAAAGTNTQFQLYTTELNIYVQD